VERGITGSRLEHWKANAGSAYDPASSKELTGGVVMKSYSTIRDLWKEAAQEEGSVGQGGGAGGNVEEERREYMSRSI